MSKFLIKLIVLVIILASFDAYSQPNFKAKERIMQFKKIKLLEILNLNEQDSQNFLIKYIAIEKKVEEKKKNLDEIVDDLEKSIRKKAPKDEIASKTSKVSAAQKEFFDAIEESSKSIKSILNEENYAKYLVFEHKFKGEVQKIIMDKMKNRKDRD